MQVDDQEEDQLVQLQEGLELLGRSQIGDDLAETQDSDELQRTEYLERGIVAAEKSLTDRVKWQSCKNVDGELATKVMPADHFDVSNLGSCPLIDVGGPETDNNIDEKEAIDNEVEGLEEEGLEGLWAEAYIKWNYEDVECGQYHDEEIPLSLSRVVNAE